MGTVDEILYIFITQGIEVENHVENGMGSMCQRASLSIIVYIHISRFRFSLSIHLGMDKMSNPYFYSVN